MKKAFITIIIILFCSSNLFSQKVGDIYALDINNFFLPLDRSGKLADIDIPPIGAGGRIDGIRFLYSGGFLLSGYSNSELWANAVASSSLIFDYLHSTYEHGTSDPRAVLYKISSSDEPFGTSWQDWIDAVALGADFYDGDGDGIYNPIDLNSNNQWDPDEDRPDIIGDEMLWCVFHDAVPSNLRRWNTVEPQGIEVRQTVFAYSTVPELLNTIFIRYRIKNTGLVTDKMTDVYFGVWQDNDIGNSEDDLVGCDTILKGSYTFNYGTDTEFGNNPPASFAQLLSGPLAYLPGITFIDNNFNGVYDEGIDTPLDTAYIHRGQLFGIQEYPGARNQPMSSAIAYINGYPQFNDPDSLHVARNYMLGLMKSGEPANPCSMPIGMVAGGIDCSEVNPLFWFSGDPVTNVGWLETVASDTRHLINTGPFTLLQGEEIEIFAAYNVGRSTDPLSSVTKVKDISDISIQIHDCNFDPDCIVTNLELDTNVYPEDYNLYQNYPNPFNPHTVIRYQLPENGEVTLKVYDVLGREVATLVNEFKHAGSYDVTFNAANLSSGVYFYKMQTTQGFIQIKKMILLR